MKGDTNIFTFESREQFEHEVEAFIQRVVIEIRKSRNPEFQTYNISSSTPYVVDYKNRKHVFVFVSANVTVTAPEIGTLTLVAGNWYNFSYIESTRFFASTTTISQLYVKCTDEEVP